MWSFKSFFPLYNALESFRFVKYKIFLKKWDLCEWYLTFCKIWQIFTFLIWRNFNLHISHCSLARGYQLCGTVGLWIVCKFNYNPSKRRKPIINTNPGYVKAANGIRSIEEWEEREENILCLTLFWTGYHRNTGWILNSKLMHLLVSSYVEKLWIISTEGFRLSVDTFTL